MALSEADALRLARLRQRRDEMIAGTKVSKVTSGPRSTEFAQGDADALQSEIEQLEALERTGRRRRRGAITFAYR